MKKRVISLLLVMCMLVSLLPVVALAAWAAEGDLPTTLKEDTYDHLIGFVRDASGLDAATRRMILRENADRLYFGA